MPNDNPAQIAPFGTWKSPISSELIVADTVTLGEIALEGDTIYWIEGRPKEAGRYVILGRRASGEVRELTPPDFNARTRVHEYGGGAFLLAEGNVVFSNFADQRLYRQTWDSTPVPLTPEAAWRYADGIFDSHRRQIICVREDHTNPDEEAINTLVAVPWDTAGSEQRVLVSGHDFVSTPRLSPDGRRLAWLAWDHPRMPWDGTELWVAELCEEDGSLKSRRIVAGGKTESIFQPSGHLTAGCITSATGPGGGICITTTWTTRRMRSPFVLAKPNLAFPNGCLGSRPTALSPRRRSFALTSTLTAVTLHDWRRNGQT